MTTSPDVSVVIPVFNGANYIQQAIDSTLAQNGVTTEIIVVDDASTDETATLVRNYGNRVRYVALEKQPTSIATTNAGLRLCTGEFVIVLHHDDYLEPRKLAAHVEVMRRHPNVALSYSALHYVGPGGEHLGTLRSPHAHRDYVVSGEIELRHMVVQNYINFCNAVVRRDAYERVGLFSEPLWFSAEWDMWIRLLRNFDVAYIDAPLVCYRLHYSAQTLTGTKDPEEVCKQLEAVFSDTFADPTLPASIRRRQSLSEANMHLSIALLQFIRRDRRGAGRSLWRTLRLVRPTAYPSLVRSSAVVPRTMSRVRLFRQQRRHA